MFFDLNIDSNYKDENNQFDFVIIGAGAAGNTIAKKLMDYGNKIALVEGGGEDYSDESQDCYKGKVLGDPYFDLDLSRLRFLEVLQIIGLVGVEVLRKLILIEGISVMNMNGL